MKTSTKWMIGIAAALVLFFLLIFYSCEIYVWGHGQDHDARQSGP